MGKETIGKNRRMYKVQDKTNIRQRQEMAKKDKDEGKDEDKYKTNHKTRQARQL